MDPNSLNRTQLEADVKKALGLLTQVQAILEKYGVRLTDEERKKSLKPPTAFFNQGPGFLRSVIAHPQLSAGTGKDPKAILEALEAIQTLAPVNELAQGIASLLGDTRIDWVNKVYGPSLEFYGVAKVLGKSNATIQTVVDSLSPVFPGHHPKKSDKTEETPPK